jgi:uncharacterized membrane protein YfcA
MSLWWLGYPLLGAFAGFVAGLFGVGGGLTIVPLLLMLFQAQDFPVQHAMHLALGTSMATIVLTSDVQHARPPRPWRRALGHRQESFAPGLMAGTFGGTFIASLDTDAAAGHGVHRHRLLRLGHHAARPQAQARSPVAGNHRAWWQWAPASAWSPA